VAYQRDASQVLTTAPDGTDPRWFGAAGHVGGLTYSYALPGGCDQLSLNLLTEPALRTALLNPGRLVSVYRGGSKVWSGKLDEGTPGPGGWAVTAHGSGTFGTDYMAFYGSGTGYLQSSTSTATETSAGWEPDTVINAAITRGLPWVNPGIVAALAAAGSPPCYMGSLAEPASTTITAFLNNITVPANLVWYVGRGNVLGVFAPPSQVTRLLVCTTPAARTLHGYYTAMWAYYQQTADSTTGTTDIPATFGTVEVINAPNAAVHGIMENFIDLSPEGVITAASAQEVCAAILAPYQAASYSQAFPVMQGQLLTTGGMPVDLGTEQAGSVCQLILADGGYGGEVLPTPITFLTGAYEFTDDTQSATITPWQSANYDLPTLLGNLSQVLQP
jgi:hypothetical protein